MLYRQYNIADIILILIKESALNRIFIMLIIPNRSWWNAEIKIGIVRISSITECANGFARVIKFGKGILNRSNWYILM